MTQTMKRVSLVVVVFAALAGCDDGGGETGNITVEQCAEDFYWECRGLCNTLNAGPACQDPGFVCERETFVRMVDACYAHCDAPFQQEGWQLACEGYGL